MTYYRQDIHHQRVSSTPHDTMSLPTRPSAPAGRPASRGQIARRAASLASMAAARGVPHTTARVSPSTQRLRPRSPPHATHNVHSTPEPPIPHAAPGRVRAHSSAPARCARRGTRRARRPLARHEVALDVRSRTPNAMISRSRVHQEKISRDGVLGREDEGFSLLSSLPALGTNV